jgi:hypothetical protein
MEDDKFLPRVIFSDEATFHLCGKVNRHNVSIWGLQNPHTTLEHERDSPKVNAFCAISQKKVYGPLFFDENTVTGVTYLAMLQNWRLPQINEDSEDFVFQQDGAPPHWHRDVRRFLNESLSHSPCDLPIVEAFTYNVWFGGCSRVKLSPSFWIALYFHLKCWWVWPTGEAKTMFVLRLNSLEALSCRSTFCHWSAKQWNMQINSIILFWNN